MEGLDKILKKISDSTRRVKSYTSFLNRKRLKDNYDDFRYFFLEIEDNGWETFFEENEFYLRFFFRKAISKLTVETETNHMITLLTEIVDRLKDEGFDSKFVLELNRKHQQVSSGNPRLPIYKYTGYNDINILSFYKNGKYSSKDYVYADAKLYLI